MRGRFRGLEQSHYSHEVPSEGKSLHFPGRQGGEAGALMCMLNVDHARNTAQYNYARQKSLRNIYNKCFCTRPSRGVMGPEIPLKGLR